MEFFSKKVKNVSPLGQLSSWTVGCIGAAANKFTASSKANENFFIKSLDLKAVFYSKITYVLQN